MTAFMPTHRLPSDGAAVWTAPDPNVPAASTADGNLEVQLLVEDQGWGHVRFSNGWEGWLDARRLTPLAPAAVPAGGPPATPQPPTPPAPPPPQPGAATATKWVPAGGSPAWISPDPSQAPVTTLAAGEPVSVLEQRGEWTQVETTAGWRGWVDGRRLEGTAPAVAPTPGPPAPSGGVVPPPVPASGPTAPARPASRGASAHLTAIGAGVVLLSSFLDWLTASGFGLNAWDLPLTGTVLSVVQGQDPSTPAEFLRVAWVLLVVAVAFVPYLGRQVNLPTGVARLAPWIAIAMAVVTVVATFRLPGVGIGLGVFACIAGGITMLWGQRSAA